MSREAGRYEEDRSKPMTKIRQKMGQIELQDAIGKVMTNYSAMELADELQVIMCFRSREGSDAQGLRRSREGNDAQGSGDEYAVIRITGANIWFDEDVIIDGTLIEPNAELNDLNSRGYIKELVRLGIIELIEEEKKELTLTYKGKQLTGSFNVLAMNKENGEVELQRSQDHDKIIAVPVSRDDYSNVFTPLKGSNGKTYLVLSASRGILEEIGRLHEQTKG